MKADVKCSVPRGFLLKAAGDRGWAVRQGDRWRFALDVCVQVTVVSQQIAGEGWCLSGVGVVRSLERGRIVITA